MPQFFFLDSRAANRVRSSLACFHRAVTLRRSAAGPNSLPLASRISAIVNSIEIRVPSLRKARTAKRFRLYWVMSGLHGLFVSFPVPLAQILRNDWVHRFAHHLFSAKSENSL